MKKVVVTCLGGDYSGKSTLLHMLDGGEFNPNVMSSGMVYYMADPLKWGLGTKHGPELRILSVRSFGVHYVKRDSI